MNEILARKGMTTIRRQARQRYCYRRPRRGYLIWFDGDGYDTIVSNGSGGSEDIIQIQNQDEEASFYDFHWVRDGNDLLVGVVANEKPTTLPR